MKKIKLSEENLIAICAISFLLLLFGIPIGTVAIQDSKTYDSMIVAVEQKNWAEAKTKLESLSQNKLKSSNDYAKLIYYNYHLNLGETLFKEKKYHNALSEYRSAFSYDSSNKNLEAQIKELEATCKKLDEIERKRAEQERLKAEQERKRAERQKQLEEQRELADLSRMVRNAFVKTELLDMGDTPATGFNFYTYRYSWNDLSYQEQKNVFNTCVRYVELKEGISWSHAYKYTRIISIESGWPMANRDTYSY